MEAPYCYGCQKATCPTCNPDDWRERVEEERDEPFQFALDAKEEGRAAYRMGGDANPHPFDSRAGRLWAEGWERERRAAQRGTDRYYEALREEGAI